jgi:hypothetical protein
MIVIPKRDLFITTCLAVFFASYNVNSDPAPTIERADVYQINASNFLFRMGACCFTLNDTDTFEWQLYDPISVEYTTKNTGKCITVPEDLGVFGMEDTTVNSSVFYRVCAFNAVGDNSTCSNVQKIFFNVSLQ